MHKAKRTVPFPVPFHRSDQLEGKPSFSGYPRGVLPFPSPQDTGKTPGEPLKFGDYWAPIPLCQTQ